MNKKSVLEQALLEAQQLEEAVKSNAKEILASTMKQEIEELVKESLNEQDEFVEDEIEDIEVPAIEDEDQEEEVSVDLPNDDEEAMVSLLDVDADVEPLDLTAASDTEVLKVFKAMGADDGVVITQNDNVIDIEDQEAGTEYKIELAENKLKSYPFINEEVDDLNEEDMIEPQEGDIDRESDLDEETLYEIELDDDVVELGVEGELGEDDYSDKRWRKHYRGAVEDDEDQIAALTDDEDYDRGREESNEHQSFPSRRHEREGMRKHYGETPDDLNPLSNAKQGYDDREDESLGMLHKGEFREGGMYKGDQGGEDYVGDKHTDVGYKPKRRGDVGGDQGGFDFKEEETNEASRTAGFGSKKGRGLRKAFTNNRNLEFNESKASQSNILKEVTKVAKKLQVENRNFKEKNKEYRKALIVFRDKLNEVAVFNANLAYSTKLFTEHTTTKQEKINILRRFDNVTTLTESKSLFKQILTDLKIQTKSLNESVRKTITRTPLGGSSINLIETKTYENPQITRMKEIMSKL